MFFGDKVLVFYKSLKITERLPKDVGVLNPYQDETAFRLCSLFYKKYYGDNHQRTMILGINPGRFGAGLTGIPFTDPVKLEKICGIPNNLPQKSELSADFVHAMIQAYGGAAIFFREFYFNSVSPLGFVMAGKNMNYYDSPQLAKSLDKFIRKSLRAQVEFGVNRQVAFCLGEGDNFKFLKRLNSEENFFMEIIPLAHPRFIMQYKRKLLETYIQEYVLKLRKASV